MRLWLLAMIVTAVMVGGPSHPARADGAWLDAPLVPWNVPGMAVPSAPATDGMLINPRCADLARPPETDEDQAVVDAGWRLSGAYEGGWGVKVVTGTANFDGMCRPVGYQQFVFVYGAFAGATSPVIMASRNDGAAVRAFIRAPGDGLTVEYSRYADSDPLCCPSSSSIVSFTIEGRAKAPVLAPVSVFTNPRS